MKNDLENFFIDFFLVFAQLFVEFIQLNVCHEINRGESERCKIGKTNVNSKIYCEKTPAQRRRRCKINTRNYPVRFNSNIYNRMTRFHLGSINVRSHLAAYTYLNILRDTHSIKVVNPLHRRNGGRAVTLEQNTKRSYTYSHMCRM